MKRDWFKQVGFSCFPIAILNYALYLGKSREELPDLEQLIDIADSRHGAAINKKETIEACGLKLERGDSDWIWRNIQHGEISIYNPSPHGCTLHSTFYFRDSGGINLVNSLMPDGRELEGIFTIGEMIKLMPKHEHHRGGYFLTL